MSGLLNQGKFQKGNVPWNAGRGVFKDCGVCGKNFYLQACLSHRKFCSKTCGYKGRVVKNSFQKGHSDLVPSSSRGHSMETKQKLSEYQRSHRRLGPDNPNWKGGLRTARQIEMGRVEYKDWRTAVFTRDHYKCVLCDSKSYLHADHIIKYADDVSKRLDVTNGRTLCYKCHYFITFGKVDDEKAIKWGIPSSRRGTA